MIQSEISNGMTQVARMTSAAEMAAVAKQAEEYILSSVKLAYDRVWLCRFEDYSINWLISSIVFQVHNNSNFNTA